MPEKGEMKAHLDTVKYLMEKLGRDGCIFLLEELWADASNKDKSKEGSDLHVFRMGRNTKVKRGQDGSQTPLAPHQIVYNVRTNPSPRTTAELNWTLREVYGDARALYLDFGEMYLKFAFLTHTSVQFYSKDIWRQSIQKVPRDVRGFKVAIAFQFSTHLLAFLSHDLVVQPNWFDPEKVPITQEIGLDVYTSFPEFLHIFSSWVESRRKVRSDREKPIVNVLRDEEHIFHGIGVYTRSEVLYMAGIHPLLTEKEVCEVPSRAARLCNAVYQFAYQAQSFFNDFVRNAIHSDNIIAPTYRQRLEYTYRLRVYGKSITTVTPREKKLLESFRCTVGGAHKDDARDDDVALSYRDELKDLYDPFEPTNMLDALASVESLKAGKVFTLGRLVFGDDIWETIVPPAVREYEGTLKTLDPLTALYTKQQKKQTFIHPTAYLDDGLIEKTPARQLRRMPTHFWWMPKQVWSVLPPFPPGSLPTRPKGTPKLKYLDIADDAEKEQATFQWIITNTRHVAIGPLEYCGHGQIVKLSQKMYVAAVRGDPRLKSISSEYTQQLSLWLSLSGRGQGKKDASTTEVTFNDRMKRILPTTPVSNAPQMATPHHLPIPSDVIDTSPFSPRYLRTQLGDFEPQDDNGNDDVLPAPPPKKSRMSQDKKLAQIGVTVEISGNRARRRPKHTM